MNENATYTAATVPISYEVKKDAEEFRGFMRPLMWEWKHTVPACGPPEPIELDVIPDEPPAEYDDEHRRLWWALHGIASAPDDDDLDGWAIDAATQAISTGREFRPGRLRPTYCPPMPEEPK